MDSTLRLLVGIDVMICNIYKRFKLTIMDVREAGVTTWGLDEKTKSISFWERALSYTKYDFEYRLTLVSLCR
jgi:hypothetical protein